MNMRIHTFTSKIFDILSKHYGDKAHALFNQSELLQYLNVKTRSADRGSKARSSFANIYALYVLIEDYVNLNFHHSGKYELYEGAKFTDLLYRQRSLPFGEKLQNHALNSRLNEEFKKFFPTSSSALPIIRDLESKRYWINENYLIIQIGSEKYNLALPIKEIIEAYIDTKKESHLRFLEDCEKLKVISNKENNKAVAFIKDLLRPNVDARVFEIASYCILKEYYAETKIFWGFTRDTLNEDYLVLYKTGRTNANDGGIDFVMRPLGRFFQVTETVDPGKYFLDIDKVQCYPITFVVKSEDSSDVIKKKIKEESKKRYMVESIVQKYMDCIEEIINLSQLHNCLEEVYAKGRIQKVVDELIQQNRLEFNIDPNGLNFSSKSH